MTLTVHPRLSLWGDSANRGRSTAVVEVVSRDSLKGCKVVGVKTGAQDTKVASPSTTTLIVRVDASQVMAARERCVSLDGSRIGGGLIR